MKRLLLTAMIFFPATAAAFNFVLTEPESVADVQAVAEPDVLQTFYGELDDFPHTFEFRSNESFWLRVALREPDTKDALLNHSVTIIRERDNGRGVETVAQLRAADATWEPLASPFGQGTLLDGGLYESEVQPGVYRVEVSTPTNHGPYVLEIGHERESLQGYFAKIRDQYHFNRFLDKPRIALLWYPPVLLPLLTLVGLFIGYSLWQRRRYG